MEKQIAEGNIGSIGQFDIEYKDGKGLVSASIGGVIGKISLVGEIEAVQLALLGLQVIEDKYPNALAKAIIEEAKLAIKAIF